MKRKKVFNPLTLRSLPKDPKKRAAMKRKIRKVYKKYEFYVRMSMDKLGMEMPDRTDRMELEELESDARDLATDISRYIQLGDLLGVYEDE